ncbi:hypothetical protein KBX31_11950 [Liquorilactobacillus satsumensis]|uniref:hypothetical protein n=1 Tax=Liquorilactobacillus TaxID=2767888 RepID=UPI0021C3A6DE|nr:hypothetical protein [Liquorilactobacillus satsumensis]MCP9313965.1 hypothetical protein [Liquorilactobacillus satsumensis]MCP9361107.1 hypothetical protein [Liquorilactobacillus satsumensis]
MSQESAYIHYEWENADPKGLNDYIIGKFSKNGQSRRIIRFLKKWKQEKFSTDDSIEKTPPSIGLTLLVVDELKENESDLLAFQSICKTILDKFEIEKDVNGKIISAKIHKYLPVKPFTDVFKKLEGSTSSEISFYKRLKKAVENLNNAVLCDDDYDAAIYVSKVLGDEFPRPKKMVTQYRTKINEEHSFG